jgi:lantibiotic modifying enzyme
LTDAGTARRCWDAVEGIGQDLAEHRPDQAADVALANGAPGQALFFSYLAVAREDSGAADQALGLLGRSIDALGATHLQPSLYGGFCGVGWVVEHLTREHFEKDGDLCADLDDALETVLSNPAPKLKYELINGLAGFGLYLLERLPQPAAETLLARILDRLEATSEETADGTTWFTLPEWVPDSQRDWMPEGGYNLGVAHGVPGVIGFLAAARREGVDDPRVARLAEGAVHWVLAQRYEAGDRSVFPTAIIPGQEPARSRTAWCYGDLGIAAVLLTAARSFDRPDWEAEALAIARRAAARPTEAFKAVDACLCHGAAGIAHIFNRLHQATGDPELRRTALDWYGHALAMRRTGEGVGGYLGWMTTGPGEHHWQAVPGFLAGSAGVGLALLAAVSGVEPSWDRVMLLAIPPRAARDGSDGAP